jgi:hypothetical protein
MSTIPITYVAATARRRSQSSFVFDRRRQSHTINAAGTISIGKKA